ncbi:MAG: thiol:disulfide interchange protein DsbA/DsbL [Gammaproteobacteria bacterium]|nr:MAG: thiol:disulfide interchange protein DsbA/DsbL [Gammaproteobacteria bacterium]
MERFVAALLAVAAFAPVSDARTAQTWIEGRNYVLLTPTQATSVPAGSIEVMEVFSYGCIACNSFQPVMERLRRNLPPNAQIVLLPASFNTGEDWPMFQRAYFAAWILGVADRTHRAMFDAIWKTGELAVSDPVTHRLKTPQPSLEDAARCYARIAGINPGAFLATARSFAVDMKIRAADAQVAAMQVPGTPCIVVNGKYRVNMDSLGNNDELIELVRFLVTKESIHQASGVARIHR